MPWLFLTPRLLGRRRKLHQRQPSFNENIRIRFRLETHYLTVCRHSLNDLISRSALWHIDCQITRWPELSQIPGPFRHYAWRLEFPTISTRRPITAKAAAIRSRHPGFAELTVRSPPSHTARFRRAELQNALAGVHL